MIVRRVVKCCIVLFSLSLVLGLYACGDKEGDIVSPSISSHADNAFFTASSSVTLRVNVEVDAVVEVAVADGLTASVPVFEGTGVDGDTWSFSVSGLLPGGNAIAVTAQDASGNQQTLFMTVTYDFVSVDRLVTPVDQTITTTLDIAGTVADSVNDVTMLALEVVPALTVTPAPVLAAANRWTADLDLTGEVDGTYTVTITANDGVTSHSVSSAFVLDSVNGIPQVAITTLPPTDIAGTRSADALVSVELNTFDQLVDTTSGLNTEWIVNSVQLKPGKNFIKVTVTDDVTGFVAVGFESVWN